MFLKNLKIKVFALVAMLSLSVLFTGCSTPEMTNTKRSAVETLILSDSVDKSLRQADLRRFAFKKAFINPANLAVEDKPYVLGRLAEHLGYQGMSLVDDRKDADFIIDVYCGTLGTDHDKFMIGIPSIAVPVPFSGTFKLPEMPFYRNISQKAFCKMRLAVWSADKSRVLYGSRYLFAVTYYNRYSVLGVSFNRTNVPLYQKEIDRSDSLSVAERESKLKVSVDYYDQKDILDSPKAKADSKAAVKEDKK